MKQGLLGRDDKRSPTARTGGVGTSNVANPRSSNAQRDSKRFYTKDGTAAQRRLSAQQQRTSSMVNQTNNNTKETSNSGCCGRFKTEFMKSEWFTEKDTNGKTLLWSETFCTTRPNHVVGMLKVFLFVFTVSVYFHGVILSTDPLFFLAYLTNWSLTYALVYQCLSMFNTWVFDSLMIMKMTWVMFEVAAVHEIVTTVCFWTVEYNSSLYQMNYYTAMAHGGVMIAILVEGLLVNRTPIRIKHVLFVQGFALLYLIWTLIQNLVIEKNPYSEDDDVALYDALAWKKNTKNAAIFATLIMFVFIPLIHLVLWGVSLCGRRYLEDQVDDKELQPQKTTNQQHHKGRKSSMLGRSKNKKASILPTTSPSSPPPTNGTRSQHATSTHATGKAKRSHDWWARPDPPTPANKSEPLMEI